MNKPILIRKINERKKLFDDEFKHLSEMNNKSFYQDLLNDFYKAEIDRLYELLMEVVSE